MIENNKKYTSVFIGSVINLDGLLEQSIVNEMLAANVGLYGHLNGIYSAVVAGYMGTLGAEMASDQSAPGVGEFGFSSGYAQGTVTIKNTSSSSITVQVGDIYTASNGQQYEVLSSPGQPGYVLGQTGANKNGYISSSSGGYYNIGSNNEVVLKLESIDDSLKGNTDINSISSLMDKNLNSIPVVSSSSFTGGGSTTNYVFSPENGAAFSSVPFYYLYQKYGFSPTEGNVNVRDEWTQNDLNAWKSYVQDARSSGVMNIAPIFTYNGLDADYSQDFSTSDYWKIYRDAALYSGGLSFDTPANFFNTFTPSWFSANGEAGTTYQNFVESQIRWATSEGLRTSIIIGPYSTDSGSEYTSNYLEGIEKMLEKLIKDNASPSQIIIENYTSSKNTNTYDSNMSNTESLNAVAAWVSENFSASPTNSEQGLEVVGASGVSLIMTGIKPTINVMSGTSTIYDAPALYASSTSDIVTMTLTLSGVHGLTLTGENGTFSNNTQTLTYSGTPEELTNVLSVLKIRDDASTSGIANLSLKFVSEDGSSIIGNTSIRYAPSEYIYSSGIETPSTLSYGSTYNFMSDPIITDSLGENDLILTVKLGSTAGKLSLLDKSGTISSDGQTLTATGTASDLSSVLSSLCFLNTAVDSGVATFNATVTDENGISTTLANTSFAYNGYTKMINLDAYTKNVNFLGFSALDLKGGLSNITYDISGTGQVNVIGSGLYNSLNDGQNYILQDGREQFILANGHSISVDASKSYGAQIVMNSSAESHVSTTSIITGNKSIVWTGSANTIVNANIKGEDDPNLIGNSSDSSSLINTQYGSNTTINYSTQSTVTWINNGSNVTINGSSATSTDLVAIDQNYVTGTTVIHGGAENLCVIEWNDPTKQTDPTAQVEIHAGSGQQTLFVGGNYDATSVYGDGENAGSQTIVLSDNISQETNVYGGRSSQQIWTSNGLLNATAGSDDDDEQLQIIIQGGSTNFTAGGQKSDIEQWGGALTADMSAGSEESYMNITLDNITKDFIYGISEMHTKSGNYSFNINTVNKDIGESLLSYNNDDAIITLGGSSIIMQGVGHSVIMTNHSNHLATISVDTRTLGV